MILSDRKIEDRNMIEDWKKDRSFELLGFILLAHIDLGDCGKRKDEIE
jgi:hypothetical protein